MNPPFNLYGMVVQKARREEAKVWLLFPFWPSGWWQDVRDFRLAGIWLPAGPLFRRKGELLPQPAWRSLVCVFDFSLKKLSAGVWWRVLKQDGDVEANPGPVGAEEMQAFHTFMMNFAL